MSTTLRQSYDKVPYQSFPFAQTHPDHLATIGAIFGVEPPPVATCRVLELGCASGGNLIPLAATLPDARFVGIDFSEVEIAAGRADIAALGLTNIALEAMDILDVDERLGTFDYIIAHGVYSWVPDVVQEKLLAIVSRQLAANGIAYVSYNTLPGWAMRGSVRAAMRFHTAQFEDPGTRAEQARAILAFLVSGTQAHAAPHGMALRAEAEEMRAREDYYLLHEYLEEINTPLYFHEFVARASKHRLRYLGEASFQSMFASDLAPDVAQTLARVAPDLVRREQFLDFLRNRTFRQTLLVHDDVTLERKLSPRAVTGLHAAARARPVRDAVDVTTDTPEEFREPGGAILRTAHKVTKSALVLLAERWPATMPFTALLAQALVLAGLPEEAGQAATTMIASMLMSGYAAGGVELHRVPAPLVVDPGSHPATGAWQAHQAQRGDRITTLRHEVLRVDAATRTLLPLLDGRRSRPEIAALAWPDLPPAQRERLLDEALPQLGRQALLAG